MLVRFVTKDTTKLKNLTKTVVLVKKIYFLSCQKIRNSVQKPEKVDDLIIALQEKKSSTYFWFLIQRKIKEKC
jgi:hypothetical protein